MGSLMAGWQTNRLDARQALKRSSSSLTNDEVKRFWRAKQNAIRRHLEEAVSVSSALIESEDLSPPSTPSTPSTPDASAPVLVSSNLGSPKSDWWTRSSWAFLNEPPISDIKQSLYRPQFDVASRVGRDEAVGTAVILPLVFQQQPGL